MYKIVAISGKMRGEEFFLRDQEMVLGRESSCDISINLDGISKRHLQFTQLGEKIVLTDLGSANGTFVNSKVTKKSILKPGDQISLPGIIFQVVLVKEKKKLVKKHVTIESQEQDSFTTPPPAPSSLVGKLIYLFRYKFMPIVHGINHDYEWRMLVGILFALFIVVTIALTIFPVLQDSKSLLLYETATRGEHYADDIARQNSAALATKSLDRVDTSFLDKESGVSSYELFDLEGRIVRPITKLNEYISDTFSIKTKEWADKSKNDGTTIFKMMLGQGEIGIGKKIMAYDAQTGSIEPVGIVAIRFAPRSLALEASKNSKAYLEAFSTSGLIAILFFGILYYLTTRPIEEMRYQLEEALRGKRNNIEGDLLFAELRPLKDSINSMLQRIREFSGEADSSLTAEDDALYVNTLLEVLKGAHGAALVLNSDKLVKGMNSQSEDLLGIRFSAAEGVSLIDVMREKGLAATIIELSDLSSGNNGTHQSSSYELTGRDYKINVISLIGKDSFAKGYYITFTLNT